jgi:hypothetical protein
MNDETETLLVPIRGTSPLIIPLPFGTGTLLPTTNAAPGQPRTADQMEKRMTSTTVTGTNGSGPDEGEGTEPVATPQLNISRIAAETIMVPIRGTSPLIVHRFSEKAKRQMLDAMQGRRTPREAKDPHAEYMAAHYVLADGRYGLPAVAFKSATVSAARFYKRDLKMTELRQFLFVNGEPSKDGQLLIPIIGESIMREDVTRVARGGTDLRYRPQFTEWSAVLPVTFVKSALTRDSVVSLIDAGGMGVGVGEWRPEKKGDFGTYEVDPTRDITIV